METEFCKSKISNSLALKDGVMLGFNYSFILNLLKITINHLLARAVWEPETCWFEPLVGISDIMKRWTALICKPSQYPVGLPLVCAVLLKHRLAFFICCYIHLRVWIPSGLFVLFLFSIPGLCTSMTFFINCTSLCPQALVECNFITSNNTWRTVEEIYLASSFLC